MTKIWQGFWLRGVVVSLALLCSCFALAQSIPDLSVTVSPLFRPEKADQMAPAGPTQVEFVNTGPPTQAIISPDSYFGSAATVIVDLPRGAIKQVLVYSGLESNGITITTDRGRIRESVVWSGRSGGVLWIGDNPSGFTFPVPAARNQWEIRAALTTVTVRPQLAPGRRSSYADLSAVFLGEGSEKLSDEAVAGLKAYVHLGGHLVFVGPPSSLALADQRWQGYVPLLDLRTTTVPGLRRVNGAGGDPLSREITILTGKPILGATVVEESGQAVETKAKIGKGTVSVVGFDLTAPPLAGWAGREVYLDRLVKFTKSGRQESDEVPTGSGDFVSVTVPPPGLVAAILIGFLVLVLPVNFFILTKLGKVEWAWVTSPILSFLFAGILLVQAGGLYQAQSRILTTGDLYLMQGDQTALFSGTTELFLARAGSYPVQMQGVETFEGSERSFPGLAASLRPPEVIDLGEIQMPNLSVTNLSFRSYRILQQVPLPEPVRIQRLSEVGNKVKVKITAGPLGFGEGILSYHNTSAPIGALAPGETKEVEFFVSPGPGRGARFEADITLPGIGPTIPGIPAENRVRLNYELDPRGWQKP